MGIKGARSMMDSDPDRFSAAFAWNFETGGPGSNQNNNEGNTLGLLIDGKSLLYHIALEKADIIHASPATINETCQVHIHRLLRVVGKKGGVHIFFDGLAPKEKTKCQIQRMGEQANVGDIMARELISKTSKLKLLHHLAEDAFIEAIGTLMKRFSGSLFMYRPAMGEGEALINQWLVQNDGLYSRVAVISEDSDFFVYESCPGYIPPSSLVYEESNGRHCLAGTYYLRSKFLRAFLGTPSTKDSTVMTTVAALSECDYVLGLPAKQSEALRTARQNIISSRLGGLRAKKQNNPSAANALLAVLRVVGHYKKIAGYRWIEQMCGDFVQHQSKCDLIVALRTIHSIYLYTLKVNAITTTELVPGSIDARRLIQHGTVFCYPLIETYQAANPSMTDPDIATFDTCFSSAVLPCPPLTTEVEKWIAMSSVWSFPLFRQIRARLYCYVASIARSGKVAPTIPFADIWTLHEEPAVEEVVRTRLGSRWRMENTLIKLPPLVLLSSMIGEELLTQIDNVSIDRGLLFCMAGSLDQLATINTIKDKAESTILLASFMLPFNLACLLLMMSTAPREINKVNFRLPSFSDTSCKEVKKVLPILSVAFSHANILANILTSFWPKESKMSSFFQPPMDASATFRHDTALLIWHSLRDQPNLEYIPASDSSFADDSKAGINRYLDGCFVRLNGLRIGQDYKLQDSLAQWKMRVAPLYLAWWQFFNG